MSGPLPVAVVGAGWAGLAAAVALTERGVPVIVYDANPRPGGRARTAPALGIEVDNGQHVAIGAYTAVADLARRIGLAPDAVFTRIALALEQRDAHGVRMSLRAPREAGRVGLGVAFVTAKGFSAADKFTLARRWPALLTAPTTDVPVREFLRAAGQPESAVRLLWEPLCLATLNTAPERASAQLFARVLREAFGAAARGAADLMLPTCDLGAALPQPAVRWLEAHGAEVRLGERVTGIAFEHGRVTAVTGARGTTPVRGAVLAVPPDACARLVAPMPDLAPLAERCESFGTQPIVTVYLRYPGGAQLPLPLLGLTGTTAQWLVDRRTCGQSGVVAAVVSADGPHMAMDNDALIARVTDEIARCVPELPAPQDARVIREKRATFDAVVGIEAMRPSARTAVPNLMLAGDWTATGLPATLEGAVRSGDTAAAALVGSE